MVFGQVSTELVFTAMGSVVAAMSTVIGVLWKIHMRQHESVTKRLDECEEDRLKLWKQLVRVQSADCDEKACPIRAARNGDSQ
jgi:hypothetical protein